MIQVPLKQQIAEEDFHSHTFEKPWSKHTKSCPLYTLHLYHKDTNKSISFLLSHKPCLPYIIPKYLPYSGKKTPSTIPPPNKEKKPEPVSTLQSHTIHTHTHHHHYHQTKPKADEYFTVPEIWIYFSCSRLTATWHKLSTSRAWWCIRVRTPHSPISDISCHSVS